MIGAAEMVSTRRGSRFGSKAKAERVDRAERRRAKMYRLMEEHPESAEELLERVRVADIRVSKEGNPLRIDGPAPEIHPAIQRKIDTKAKKAAGMVLRRIRADNGSIQEVWTFSHSYLTMGFQDHQIAAAERFGRDWEAAYRTIRAAGLEFGVDGGRAPHRMHHSQVDAQTRLRACEAQLGRRLYAIVVAVVIHGATSREIHAMGGKDHRSVKSDMDVAFNELDAFYHGSRPKDRTWEAFDRFNAERSAMIERAEREVG